MTTNIREPQSPPPNTPAPAPAKGGCFSGFIFLFGLLTIVIALFGYIAGLFGMVLKISGSKLPKIDLPIFLILLAVGVISLGIGWLVGKLEASISKRKQQKKS